MKYKIAAFYNTRFGYDCVSTEMLGGAADYVRVSEYVEVDFPALFDDPVKQAIKEKRQQQIADMKQTIKEMEEEIE